ncbi:unnamed protein product, partial [Iphiclides podalirius]
MAARCGGAGAPVAVTITPYPLPPARSPPSLSLSTLQRRSWPCDPSETIKPFRVRGIIPGIEGGLIGDRVVSGVELRPGQEARRASNMIGAEINWKLAKRDLCLSFWVTAAGENNESAAFRGAVIF